MSVQKAVQSEYALQQSAYEPSAEDFVFDKSIDIYTDRNYASVGFWKGVFTRFFKNVRAVIGLVIIVVCMFLALVGPHMNRYGYSDIQSVYDQETGKEITARSLSPRIPWLHRMISGEEYQDEFADRTFLFGTDSLGRDLWTRVWYGARVSLLIAFVTIFIDMIVGMSFGLISGYFGGFADDIMQRFVEIANSIPRLVIVGVLATIMPKGIGLVIVALLLTEWIGMSKIARAEMLKNKEQEYIMASRTLGAGSGRIIFIDILPNTIGPIITQMMFSIPTAIFTEAFLSFVGVGIMLPQCSIGSLIEDGFNNITTLPYQIVPPILVLAFLMLAFNFVGDGLREALAPRIEDM